MSKIINVTPSDDYRLLVEFETGSNISFNMGEMVKTLPYASLKELTNFKKVVFDEKAVYWTIFDAGKPEKNTLRVTVDTMLFSMRD